MTRSKSATRFGCASREARRYSFLKRKQAFATRRERLDGDALAGLAVDRLVDDAHAAAADLADHAIARVGRERARQPG